MSHAAASRHAIFPCDENGRRDGECQPTTGVEELPRGCEEVKSRREFNRLVLEEA